MATTIKMSEQVGVGNFGGDDNEQKHAANKYAKLMTEHFEEYCTTNYPDAEVKIDFSVENVSGIMRKFEVFAMGENEDAIQDAINLEFDSFARKLERTGEIYE